MNGIAAKANDNKLLGVLSPKTSESVETAGSLAMNPFYSLFSTNVYDVFTSSNPFSVDYSQYTDSGETVAYSGGFLSNFSNAVSTLSSSGGYSDGSGCSVTSSGFSGGTSSGSCGGFTSFC